MRNRSVLQSKLVDIFNIFRIQLCIFSTSKFQKMSTCTIDKKKVWRTSFSNVTFLWEQANFPENFLKICKHFILT